MITNTQISKLLFFDIETCGRYASFEHMKEENPQLANAWETKASFHGSLASEMYDEKVALYPEFGKIVCVSYGIYHEGNKSVSTIEDDNEEDLIKKVSMLFQKCAVRDSIPTGWNIKNFDIPWIQRKLLMHGLRIPSAISTFEVKPWEVRMLDLKEMWKGFSNLQFSFDDVVISMGLNSPKTDMDGSKVHRAYWNGEKKKIIEYCERDVNSMIDFAEKIKDIYD